MKSIDFKVKDVEYFVQEPSNRTKREAAEYKAEVFKREAFKKDENGKLIAIFADQVYNLMREKGIWTDKDDEDLKSVSKKLDEKLALLARGKTETVNTVDKLRNVILHEVKELRKEQFKLLAKSNKFNEITVESVCDQAENDYLTCFSTYTDTEIGAFKSFEDFQNADEELKEEASRQLSILLGYADPDWVMKLPENKILLKHKLIDDKGNYLLKGVKVNIDGKPINDLGQLVNDEGKAVDEDGNLVDEKGEPLGYTAFDDEVVSE